MTIFGRSRFLASPVVPWRGQYRFLDYRDGSRDPAPEEVEQPEE